MSQPTEGVPVISIGRSTDRHGGALPESLPASEETVAAIGDACERIGFMVITDHGIDQSLIDRMRDVSRSFFAQPQPVKSRYSADPPNRYRGYANSLLGGVGYGEGASGGRLDYVESYEVGRWDCAAEMRAAGYGPDLVTGDEFNIWPDEFPEFKATWQAYFDEMTRLSDDLLSLAARALELPPDWFADKFSRRPSHLAVNHYPGQTDRAPEEGQLRQKAHTDIGAITLLLQADTGGLQVFNRQGEWVDVPVLPDTYVVNLGDLLAKWTNDRWVATRHRVLNPPADERHIPRMSIPFFDRPNLDALIECIPTCRSGGAKYEAVRAADWVAYRQSMYGQQSKG